MINSKSPLLAPEYNGTGYIKFEPIFLTGSLAVFNQERSLKWAGGGSARPRLLFGEICSNIFECTPPFNTWLALCEGSPADFPINSEFFIFVPQ
jgi:hypothetical protein